MKISPKKRILTIVIFAGIFGIIGVATLLLSHAFNNGDSYVDPEEGIVTGSASVIPADGTSHGGGVRFGAQNSPRCLPVPAFPNAQCTGLTSIGSLEAVRSGNQTISQPGTYENWHVRGHLTINASNVILRNCLIEADPNGGVIANVLQLEKGKSLTIENCEIKGNNKASEAIRMVEDTTSSLVARNLNINGAGDGLAVSGRWEIYDSFIHSFYDDGTGSEHNDGIEVYTSTASIIRHNTILLQPTAGANSPFYVDAYANDVVENMLVENNLLGGGGYVVYLSGATPSTVRGVTFRNNKFTRQFYSGCGNFGVLFPSRKGQYTWTGNTVFETGATVADSSSPC